MADQPKPRPSLFRAEGAGAAPGRPALLGGRCRACGYVFFPMQTYGCEACGATDLEPMALAGRGVLTSFARVHVHASPGRQAPFTVGSIVTDDGAVVRTLIEEESEAALRPGAVMVALLVPETRPGHGDFDLRFGVAAEAEA